MARCGGVYLAIVGGAAALTTRQIEAIEHVWWEDLMPECFWQFRVKDFGPLIVAIDAHGNSLYKRHPAARGGAHSRAEFTPPSLPLRRTASPAGKGGV